MFECNEITFEDFNSAFACTDDPFERTKFDLQCFFGLSVEEMSALKIKDVEFTEQNVVIHIPSAQGLPATRFRLFDNAEPFGGYADFADHMSKVTLILLRKGIPFDRELPFFLEVREGKVCRKDLGEYSFFYEFGEDYTPADENHIFRKNLARQLYLTGAGSKSIARFLRLPDEKEVWKYLGEYRCFEQAPNLYNRSLIVEDEAEPEKKSP